ncbi:putative Phosphoglycolate phosphatase [Vibrio nigripulchritudo SFn27]|uniref:phosphoglycolate phosphatase n=1 Tax=Vibrio nigripulchritudo TaxID=28173 RepID=U4K4P0_9VIBR|nr:HAD-IA family hydrolase [Vibrio nigripulchritudo]CCN85237.1 putative Phosphoglycolate phosphatase [Vibrio nigripulchritudo BLFn1]CCN87613.1 putative Phosphoglycolate phosphatase [Vibrio nigripulchritudo SFn27]CCN92494.1 putative Phosphoglycolate phosphatase [Vibrio nigripulchritudo ENn2]CCO39357.1 putative Phosphoglycolate phosphatase [Vibrio nigripulchritudo SFn135]CCO53415.1 putative Phosphoglycolate phosphatase [Vibrio nigripulchritudo Wn13]
MSEHLKQYDAFIFDLDGTLINSAPDIAAAMNRVLADFGQGSLSTSEIERFIGFGSERLVADVLDICGLSMTREQLKEAVIQYNQYYNESPATLTTFYPNVKEDLEMLAQKGYKLGVCTNKNHKLTQTVLRLLGIDNLIDVAIGADAVTRCKPDPLHLIEVAKRMSLNGKPWAYIGDTPVDQQTAEQAGVTFFAVPWGGGSELKINEQYRLSRLSDLTTFRKEP